MAKGHEGWLAVIPETTGWGVSPTIDEGKYLYADEESLGVGKEFTERSDKITYGRVLKASSRIDGPQKPGGGVTFQMRSDDCIHVLMAHYQKYIGSQLGVSAGTSRYTFVPTKAEPDWGGVSFGTGSYTSPSGDMYTVSVVKKFFDTSSYGGTNSMWFKSCFVDSIEMTHEANEDAKLNCTFKAYDVDAGTALDETLNPNNSTFGSYSTKSSFVGWSGTLNYAGGSIDVTSFNIQTSSNTEDRSVIGKKNPSKYPFGRFSVKGSFDLDLPKDGLKYVGSMLADETFSFDGTLYNGEHDSIKFSLPNCKYEAFDLTLAGGNNETTLSIPFAAYESEDGETAPITVVVENTGYGTVFDIL